MKIFRTFMDILSDHAAYRQQIQKLAKADVIRTYRGATLGWLWAIIKPAFTIFIYWFTFAIGIRISRNIDGFPFFFWLIAGIVPWFYMNDMLLAGTRSIKRYSYLVTKMKFPIATIPTFVSLSNLLVHLGLTAIMIAIFWIAGYPPDIYFLQLPFYTLSMFLFFTIVSLFTSLLAAISHDFANLIRSIIVAIFWLSGIMWDISGAPTALKRALKLNPVTYLTYGYRNVFIGKIWFFEQSRQMMYFFIIMLIFLLLSLLLYERLRKEIPDVL